MLFLFSSPILCLCSTFRKLYYELLNIHQLIEPKRILNVSLRMVQLSLDVGCTEVSPLAFAYFGATAVMAGNPSQAYRLGSLALRLATKLNATGYMSMLLAVVQSCIAWVSEPFQSLAESHLLGYQAGERSDLFSSSANYISYLNASFSCGKHLDSIRDDSSKFIEALLRKNIKWFLFMSIWQFFDAVALIEGLEFKAVDLIAGIPSENDIVTLAARTEQVSLSFEISIHQMMRSFFFRQHNEMLNGCVDVSQFISKVARRVRPLYLNGVFFEGLISFCMARQTKQHKWVYKGEAALTFMKKWAEFSSWNFENKSLLLEAENMFLLERFDQADRVSHIFSLCTRFETMIFFADICCPLLVIHTSYQICAKAQNPSRRGYFL